MTPRERDIRPDPPARAARGGGFHRACGDGLERIRPADAAPWLVRQTSLMLTECADLARLIVIRLEPTFTSLRTAIAERGGPWKAFVCVLSSTVASIVALFKPPSRGRSPNHRSRPLRLQPGLAAACPGGGGRRGDRRGRGLRPRPGAADNLVLELFPSGTPASNGPGNSGGGGQAPTLNGQSAPSGAVPTSSQTGSARPSPGASCSSTPKAQATPTAPATDVPDPHRLAERRRRPTPRRRPPRRRPPRRRTPRPTSAVSLGGSGIRTVASIARSPAAGRPARPRARSRGDQASRCGGHHAARSAPAAGPAEHDRRGDQPGGGGPQHGRAQVGRHGAGPGQRGRLGRAHPAFRADDHHEIAATTAAATGSAPGGGRIEQHGQAAGAHGRITSCVDAGPVTSGQPGPAGLLGGLPGGRPPAGQRPLPAVALPVGDAALRRPGHDHVHADLGHQLHRQRAAVALGQRLHHHDGRLGGAAPPAAARTRELAACPPRGPVTTHSATMPAPSVTSTRSPTASRRTVARVAALRAGQDDHVAGQVRGGGEEDRRRASGPCSPRRRLRPVIPAP